MEFRVKLDYPGLDPDKARGIVRQSLGMFSGYLLRRVKGRFAAEGPNWPPRKEETAAAATKGLRVRGLAEHRLRRKLERDLRRAQVRANRGKGSLLAVARRRLVLAEFNRQVAGGQVDTEKAKGSAKDKSVAAFLGKTRGDRRLQKSVAGLQQRAERAERATAGRILGRGGSATYKKLTRSTLEVGNKIPWWGAQEGGGTVGHGAKLPERAAYYLEEADAEVLVEIMVNLALKALGSGG